MYRVSLLPTVAIVPERGGADMKRMLAFTAAAAIVLAMMMAPAGATGTTGSVTGGGSGTFPDGFGTITGDRLSIELTARVLPSGTTLGRFHMMHMSKEGVVMADLSGTLDCVVVSNGQASASGTIASGFVADPPGFDPAGQTAAFTIVDQGSSDLAGVDLSFFGSPHAIPPCENVTPYLVIDEGGFTVSS
jgi:hypothetical protein